jgi:UDP-2,4-diacetamido-2,4,6-trideoxy-beta-L-altropyranose hydrolase
MPHIVFRVDASASIGTGHFARCANLADVLAARGAEIRFLARTLPAHCQARLQSRGFRLHSLPAAPGSPPETDGAQARAALEDAAPVDWLVVDQYGIDARWERAMRTAARRILVLDDLADRAHDCDVLLDQNIQGARERYTGLVSPSCVQLLGPRHALLAPEFARLRAGARQRDGQVRRLVVCFGGADPAGHTRAAIDALAPLAGRLERVDVVAGAANPDRDRVAEAVATLPNALFHGATGDLAALLDAADLAIGAGGTMNWERACLGLPTLAFGIADNQRPVLTSLIEAGCVIGVAAMPIPDVRRMSAWLACVIDNPALLLGLSRRSAALVDGRGAERVADALLPDALEFRRATRADEENILRWRNDPSVRGMSANADWIERDAHATWLRGILDDPRRILLVAERNGEPAGVVRFDLAPPEATISVYRVPAATARGGLVRQASSWLRAHQPGIRRIVAEVLPQNAVSLTAFRAAGYHEAKNVLVLDLEAPR